MELIAILCVGLLIGFGVGHREGTKVGTLTGWNDAHTANWLKHCHDPWVGPPDDVVRM